jgi:hypothetical protein
MTILPPPKLVIVESPYRATPYYTQEQHKLYLLHCLADCYRRGEAPFASHHLAPEVLNDDDDYERAVGIRTGTAWGKYADLVAVYSDLGVGPGMKAAIEYYKSIKKPLEWRRLPDRIVAAVKGFGESTLMETPPDESIVLGIDSPAVSFADR